MTLAQLGVPHPRAAQQQGWAWVTIPGEGGSPDAIQAHRCAAYTALCSDIFFSLIDISDQTFRSGHFKP